ncbi:MAG TPA: FAD-dependent oxidoreductase [Candidatus Saccharimonadales bacterium]|nr:FAD-dependent oxidoreductase [Candidatus Saccharimonadales bacterium]
MLRTIDAFLNRYTMYRIVLYGLAALLVAAEALSLAGAIAVPAGGLALAVAILSAGCYAANKLFAMVFRAATNTESWLISALILACIMPQATSVTRAAYLLLAAVVAMASKYVLVWRGSHVFNPAAVAAFVLGVAGLLPATWWVATPWLAPFTAVLAVVVLRKIRNFTVCVVFGAVAVALLVYIGVVLHGFELGDTVKAAVLSWPVIFLGSIMLTEPTTLPPTRYYQILVAMLVGAVFAAQTHVWKVYSTPETALLIGNIFTLLFVPATGAMLRLRRITQMSPDIYDAAFEQPRRRLSFTPGQYMEWTLPHRHADSRGNRRLFSIASAPGEQDIHIGFRHYAPSSSFKDALLALKPGQYIRTAHVAGNFTLPADARRPLLFVVGGIGITPVRSMMQHLLATGERRDMALVYFANREEDFVYADVMHEAEAIGLKAHFVVGRPDAAVLQQNVPDLAGRLAYLSGPDALVTACKGMLRGLGTPIQNIRTDHFTGY